MKKKLLFILFVFSISMVNPKRPKTSDVLIMVENLEKKVDQIAKRVDTLDLKVKNILPRLTRLEQIISNDGPDSDGDGVPDIRDTSPNTPLNTPVDFWGKALNIPDLTSGKGGFSTLTEEAPAVYFGFDQINLDESALETIRRIAMKMKSDATLFVEVRGYCDYMGNNPYNNLLSQRRSDRVKAELVNVWSIPTDHIIANGKGKVIEPRTKYRPNRRCDFFFGKP